MANIEIAHLRKKGYLRRSHILDQKYTNNSLKQDTEDLRHELEKNAIFKKKKIFCQIFVLILINSSVAPESML